MSINPTSQVKSLTLTTFMNRIKGDEGAQLFVLNRSRPRNALALSVLMDNNQQDVIIVPATYLPFELTLKAQLQNILKSATFKRALTSGDLLIADTETVHTYMRGSETARKDYLEANGHEWFDTSAAQDLDIDLGNDEADSASDRREALNAASSPNTRFSENETVNDLIQQSRGGADAESINTAILNSADMLDADDLLCIANNVTDSDVKDFCLSQQQQQ